MARYLILSGMVLILLSCCSPRLLTIRGNALARQGKIREAVTKYSAAIENLKPGRGAILENWLRFNLGTAYYLLGETAGAEEQWDLMGSPSSAVLRYNRNYNMGILEFQQGDYGAAAEYFREALRFDPGDTDAKVNLELATRNKNATSQKSGSTAVSPGSRALDEVRSENLLSRVRALEVFKPGIPEDTEGAKDGKDW